MHLLVVILGSVLLSKAYTLNCHECIPGGTCSQKECSLGHCGVTRILVYAGDTKLSDMNMKTCLPADQCIGGSVNFGISRTVFNTTCCSTELCNSQTAAVTPASASANGKRCYGCVDNSCSVLNCVGNEDHCISATVQVGDQKMKLGGCASGNICTGVSAAGAIGSGMSCCEGDLCNGARTIGFSVLLLVAPVVSVSLFQ
ncbi:uncharacterized protein ACJ7VT_021024 [Polymixia lowei]